MNFNFGTIGYKNSSAHEPVPKNMPHFLRFMTKLRRFFDFQAITLHMGKPLQVIPTMSCFAYPS